MRRQVGGDHYQNMAVEPLDFAESVNRDHYEGFLRVSVLKYISRYDKKHVGKADEKKLAQEDVAKAAHCCEMLAEHLRSKLVLPSHGVTIMRDDTDVA